MSPEPVTLYSSFLGSVLAFLLPMTSWESLQPVNTWLSLAGEISQSAPSHLELLSATSIAPKKGIGSDNKQIINGPWLRCCHSSFPPPLAKDVNHQMELDPMSFLFLWTAFMHVITFTLARKKI